MGIRIAAKDHGYVDGAQHQRRDRYLAAPYDTGLFVLANAEGKRHFLNPAEEAEKKRFTADKQTETRTRKPGNKVNFSQLISLSVSEAADKGHELVKRSVKSIPASSSDISPQVFVALKKDLRDAFATAVPTKAEAERRFRDGRGGGDLDGGGRKYKGKKKCIKAKKLSVLEHSGVRDLRYRTTEKGGKRLKIKNTRRIHRMA